MKLRELNILLFAAFAFFMLAIRNGDVLYTLSEQSLFVPGRMFWEEMGGLGGSVEWTACFLTQFLHLPWLGAMLFIVLWSAIYYGVVRSFSLRGAWTLLALCPPAVLLCLLISQGYHVYYPERQGTAFVPTLLTLISVAVLLLLCFFVRIFVLKKKASQSREQLPPKKHGQACAVACFVLFWAALVGVTFHYDYDDANYHHELRMARAVDECRWDDVLAEFPALRQEDDVPRPTNLMVVFKNIALQHTGRITDMFATGNCGTLPTVRDSLTVHLSQQAAPMIYYQVGLFNFAYRWAMENSVRYGLTFANLKMMVRCAIWNGERELAEKYLNLLRTSLFHREWAAERIGWMNDAGRFQAHPEYQAIVPLLGDDANMLDFDNGLCEKFILDHFSSLRTERPSLEDFALCVSLWTESVADFAQQLSLWLGHHPGHLPILYQEAALLISQMEGAPDWLLQLNYDNAVKERYQRFLAESYALRNRGLSEHDMASQLRPTYGDTYWWYYYFYTDFNIY
ncbi:MAG: hypothetical protein II801_05540 [Bacteroidaceae bacterium]|nr:hypothetical protein [Bacteroidaceae bacterium]